VHRETGPPSVRTEASLTLYRPLHTSSKDFIHLVTQSPRRRGVLVSSAPIKYPAFGIDTNLCSYIA